MRQPTAGILWSLATAACALLDHQERDIVRGDLVESGAGGARALREVAGLVLRRQAAAWLDWRPWLMVVGVVLPIGLLLSHASRWWGVAAALNVANYSLLWDFAYLGNPGWRRDLIRFVAGTGVTWLALIGWSWTSGFILGRVSRRALWVTLGLFALVVFAGTFGTVSTVQRRVPTSSLQYYVVFVVAPQLLRTVLVLLPAVLGARRGHARREDRGGGKHAGRGHDRHHARHADVHEIAAADRSAVSLLDTDRAPVAILTVKLYR